MRPVARHNFGAVGLHYCGASTIKAEQILDTDIEDMLRQVTQGRVFDPETIQIMVLAIESATAQLPLHAGSKYAIGLAKSVMDQAALGERNVSIMRSTALLSVQNAAYE